MINRVHNNVDINKPGTWSKYRKGMCDDCVANCCRMPVEVTLDDLIRMDILCEFHLKEDLKKISKNLKKEGMISHFNMKSEIFTLSQKANGDCFWLDSDSRLCSLYENRPETCRNHPKISSRPGFCAYQKK